MKKSYILFIILLLIFILFFLFLKFPKKERKEQRYSFYKEDKETRYNEYKLNHPNLSNLEIITRVNLNLDQPFYTNTSPAKYLNTNHILVNKYFYLEPNYIPDNLEKLTSCAGGSRYLVKEAKEHLEHLCNDIKKENLNLRVISSYRSYNYQKTLYDNYVLKDGVKSADTYSARPGFSEHQTGLVIDVDNTNIDFNSFENTEEFKWMIDNSYKYGFILRYPYGKEDITGYSYESWHYRYVGIDAATKIFENNLTFDEYFARYIEK